MILLSYLSVLEFEGDDASQFLQNQLSADIAAIPEGQSGFACLCNPQGRVLGLVLVRRDAAACTVICAAALAGKIIEHLARFIFRMDVRIAPRPDLAVTGGAVGTGQGMAFPNPTGIAYTVLPAAGADATPGGPEMAWKARELAAGIAWLDTATAARYLPQMLGAEAIGALSFRKGCFPGQEIVARTRYLGKLKRRPVHCLVREAFEPEVRAAITLLGEDGPATAEIVDFARCDEHAIQLFLVARIGASFEPRALERDGREVPAEFAVPG